MKGFRLNLKISGGGFRIPPEHRDWYNATLEECRKKNNGYALVTIQQPKRIRSTGNKSQSHHLNGHVQQIATITGQPFGDVKEYVKTSAIDRGYPMLKKDDGSIFTNVWGQPRGISEAEASVEDCIILIEQVHQLAAELNITLKES